MGGNVFRDSFLRQRFVGYVLGRVCFGIRFWWERFWGIISQIHFLVAQIALNIKRDETPLRRYSDRPFSQKADSRPTPDRASRPFFRAIPV